MTSAGAQAGRQYTHALMLQRRAVCFVHWRTVRVELLGRVVREDGLLRNLASLGRHLLAQNLGSLGGLREGASRWRWCTPSCSRRSRPRRGTSRCRWSTTPWQSSTCCHLRKLFRIFRFTLCALHLGASPFSPYALPPRPNEERATDERTTAKAGRGFCGRVPARWCLCMLLSLPCSASVV